MPQAKYPVFLLAVPLTAGEDEASPSASNENAEPIIKRERASTTIACEQCRSRKIKVSTVLPPTLPPHHKAISELELV